MSLEYKIFEGRDHYRNRPLYQVIGVNNEYTGEWHKEHLEALKELKSISRKGGAA